LNRHVESEEGEEKNKCLALKVRINEKSSFNLTSCKCGIKGHKIQLLSKSKEIFKSK